MHVNQPAFTSTAGGVDELEALLTAQRLSFLASSLAVDSPEMLRNGISAFRAALDPLRLPAASPLSTEALPTHEASPSQGSTVLAGGDKSASSGPCTCMCKDGPGIDTASVLQLKIQLDSIQIEVLRGSNQMNELIQSIMEFKTEIQAIRAALEELKTTSFRGLDASPPFIISPTPIRPPSLEDFGHTVRRIETPKLEPSSSPVIVARSFSPPPGLQSVTQSVATTPITTPYTTSPHLPSLPTRTATPIVTCPSSQSRRHSLPSRYHKRLESSGQELRVAFPRSYVPPLQACGRPASEVVRHYPVIELPQTFPLHPSVAVLSGLGTIGQESALAKPSGE
ncbi:hypothetical protein FRC04_011214 [Tulasnella sp. 424]|nr:hypothetical protein FRC04_011214 [Tulasnella sp. 424]KAG8971748.1 hypothetical protein FRC05_010815 [Tulasnella sp. 425]